MNALSRLIKECRNMRELEQIHSQIITSPHLPPLDGDHRNATATAFLLLSRLLFFCALSPSGSLPYAAALFQSIPNPNLFVYNTMIRAHARHNSTDSGSSQNSLSLYKQMFSHGIQPDHLTFPFLLKHCARHQDSEAGQALHAHVLKQGFDKDVFVGNTMIYMYATCGLSSCAGQVFREMPERDVVSWNSILIGYLRCGELDMALALFLEMKERNVRTWNSIITGLVQGGRAKEALAFFHEMQCSGDNCVRPDKITIASVVSACAALGALDQGKWVHWYLKRGGLDLDVVIGTALVDMYGKCGCVERAVEVFEDMPRKDVLAWTAMISVFALHGHGEEAFRLLLDMEKHGVRPNHVTFGALLSACAHSGLVEKARWCFDTMSQTYSIEPNAQHYACMVDLLGRAGLFEEATGLIGSMPMEPDVFVWGALLGGCQMHVNVELGEKVAGYLIGLDPLNHAFYIILSDIYAKANMFDDVKKVRAFMKERGIKKMAPGCSMIEVDGQVHEFSVKGAPEVAMEKIMSVLNGVTDQLKLLDCDPNDCLEWKLAEVDIFSV